MDTANILDQLDSLEVRLTADGDKLRFKPASRVPPELIEELRQHKADILKELGKPPTKPRLVEAPSLWHAETIAEAVEREGVSIFWSDLFGEMVTFVKNDSFKDRIPCGIVAYTVEELRELFKKGEVSQHHLKLVHEAKKQGAEIAGHE